MEKHEELYQEYTQRLGQYIAALKEAETEHKEKGDQAAVIRQKVKGNVAEIFQKMFQISYNNTYVKRQIPDFVKYEETYPERHERLQAAYLDFFNKIPAPWREKAEKDQRFGRQAEFATEQLKLAIAEELKALFIGCYTRIYGE